MTTPTCLMPIGEHLGYSLDDYRTFLSGALTESFMSHDTIQAYHSAFFGNGRNAMKGVCGEAKEIRSRFVSRQHTQAYRRQAEALQQKEADAAFLQFVTAIEREKVYYYLLCATVTNPVVIVKSPSSNAEMKRFLGYEWSDSKGNEGIKYLNVTVQNGDDNDGDEDDNTMQQIRGIDGISTPLFNPANLYDTEKINSIIRAAFTGNDIIIPDELSSRVEVYSLVDLIDFSRSDFNKEIKTTPILSYPQIESKYPSEKIGVIAPYVTDKVSSNSIDMSAYVTTANMLQNRAGVESTNEAPDIERVTAYKTGDILVSNIRPYLKKIWLANRGGGCSNDVLVFRNSKPKEYDTQYLHTILSLDIFFDYMMVGKTGLKMPRGDKKIIPGFLIPKPPMDIQRQIAQECNQVEMEFQQSKKRVEDIQKQIDFLFQQAQSQAFIPVRLNREETFEIQIGQRILKSEIIPDGTFSVFSANVFEPFGRTNHSVLSDFTIPSILWGIDGDWMVNYIDKDILFNPTDHCGVIRVLDETEVIPRYLVYPLLKAGEIERFSRANRASTERIKALTLMVPSIEIQKQVVAQVSPLEQEVTRLRQKMVSCPAIKQSILDNYLK